MEETNKNGFMDVVKSIGKWIYTLRGIIMSVPVAIAAVILALRNSVKLPDVVTFDTAGTKAGELIFKSISISKNVAVMVPLIITLVCLVMTFCSKKVVYPWLISVFSLLLPIVLLLINTFP